MANGSGNYMLSIVSTFVTLAVLILFHLFEAYLDKINHEKLLMLVFTNADFDNLLMVEDIIHKHKLKLQRRLVNKQDDCLQAAIFVTGHKKYIARLDEELLTISEIKSF